MATMASRLGYIYSQALFKYPIATQAVQVSLMMGSSDLIAQCAVEKTPLSKVDWGRTAKFGGMGLFFVGPALRIWYGKLDIIVHHNQKEWKRVIKKVSLDQIVFAPIITVTLIPIYSLLQGLKPNEIVERLRKDFVKVMVMNYKLWPAAQIINFSLIPLNYQVAFAQLIAIVWNVYLSVILTK